MLHLAFETSGPTGTVALGDSNAPTPRVVKALPRKRRGQVDLMSVAAALLAEQNAAPADLALVSLALGPGSFTGLRVAVATAKMLALTLDVKIVGIPTLAILQAQHPQAVIALNIKRDTAWSAGPGLEPALRPLEELSQSGLSLVGDLPNAIHPPEADVATLYRLAHAQHLAAHYDDPLALVPAYIREPEAITLWDKIHGPA
ncbi:MAG: tRNA (adenosine(37)-N6)-threonylcarbamoyltransferase complex dimerization subunit type 1 TsaB [Algisphaera sp.]